MKKEFYKLLKFPSRDTKNGVLTVYEYAQTASADRTAESQTLPFQPKRILTMQGMKNSDVRGGHTHHETRQILFCLKGSCVVDLDSGSEKVSVTLSATNEGVLLLPYVWHVMRNFSDDAILLVIADTEYDEKDYIRSYEDFMKFIAEKKPW